MMDFFRYLVNKSNTLDKVDLSAGLRELVFQMKKSGDFEIQSLKKDVHDLFPEQPQPNQYLLRIHEVLYGICKAAFL